MIEAADGFATPELRQPLLLLGVAPERVDGVHHERALDARHRAEAGIACFQFLHEDAVRRLARSGEPVAVEVRCVEPEFAHPFDGLRRKRAVEPVVADVVLDLGFDEVPGRLSNRSLLFSQV